MNRCQDATEHLFTKGPAGYAQRCMSSPTPLPDPDRPAQAVQVARLYYYQNLTTAQIAQELGLSRPKVSRLLGMARRSGLVEIRIHDPAEHPQALEAALREHFPRCTPHVVSVPPHSSPQTALERVADYAAGLLGRTLQAGQTVGLAWGTTLNAVSRALTPRTLPGSTFVQLNGSANASDFVSEFVTSSLERFAHNYGGRAVLFPVPTFFDHPETKRLMWQERSVQHVLELQRQAQTWVYSLGELGGAGVSSSHVYAAGYLEQADLAGLREGGVVGDLATVFFKADGSSQGIPLNQRASGPELSLLQTRQGICIVAGRSKAQVLHAALRGGLANVLVVDELTARDVLECAASEVLSV